MNCPHCGKEIDSEGDLFGKIENSRGENQKSGMIKKAQQGKHMSRAPFGYTLEKGKLIPSEKSKEVEEIFEEFLNEDFNLTKISQKHNLSINGIKKVLRNFTYIGKIKFDGEIHPANHQPIISSILFNKVQDKLEK
jgi:site-specific DNA recombinase